MPKASARQFDRALGALFGCAIGDAMGMPTQSLTREAIAVAYGHIEGFRAASNSHPFAGGLPAGSITDDTEQTLLLARLMADCGESFDEHAWSRALLGWERETIERGVHDLLGPSTKRALEELARGVPPDQTGLLGTTNGASMRIAPVGIATPASPLERLIERVGEVCRVTHNTAEAIGAAAAVAAVVSCAIDGAEFEDALATARKAAGMGEARARQVGSVKFSTQLDRALELAEASRNPDFALDIAAEIGTSVAACQSVPMAFAVARIAGRDVMQAARISANLGGDTDTIGAIACAMIGACVGASGIPSDAVATVISVNRLELEPLVERLLAMRAGRSRLAAGGAP